MSPDQTRKRFAKLVKKDGNPATAARLLCSTTQVQYIVEGKRNPGMRLARRIEAIYGIPMQDWVETPKIRNVKGIA